MGIADTRTIGCIFLKEINILVTEFVSVSTYMCVYVSPFMCVFKVTDVFICGEGFAQVSFYVYVFACESVYVCDLVSRCDRIWLRLCVGRV